MVEKLFKSIKQLFVSRTIVHAEYEQETMTVKWSDGVTEKYEGSATVWRKHPLMKRCATSKEIILSDIANYCLKWGNPYPTAHKK